MKIIFGILILVSATLSAQEKKIDTIKKSYPFKSDIFRKELAGKSRDFQKSDSVELSNNPYKMLVGKPKDTSVYLSLKGADKDYSKYKILNSITPEPSKKEIKK